MEAGGQAVLDNLPLLFAIGVAIDFTEGPGPGDSRRASAMSSSRASTTLRR
jgi:hypothetical protein